MHLAVISDIHGNYKALEAFLDYITQFSIDGIICLGDYVTDSPYPQRTMELIYKMRDQYTCYMLRGNREDYIIDNSEKDQGWKPSSSNGALYYTAKHIKDKDISFFKSLPTVDTVAIKGYPPITICHGTPDEVRGNVTLDIHLREKVLATISTDYLMGGHSHNQEIYEQKSKQNGNPGRVYLNPGSLGLAIDGVGRHAQFAIMEGNENEWIPTLYSIPYDVNGFLQDFTCSGLDEYGIILNRAIKKTLVTGINYFYKSIVRAVELSGEPLPKISEEIWQRVATELDL